MSQEENSYLQHISKLRMVILGYSLIIIGTIMLLLPFILPMNQTLSELCKLFGAALLPSSIVGLIYEHTLRKSFLNEMRTSLHYTILSQFAPLRRINASGLDDVYENYPTSEICKSIENSKRIKILTGWIPDFGTIFISIKKAIENGAIVEINMLDPDSSHAQYRSRTLGYPDDHLSIEIEHNKRMLERYALENNLKKQLIIKFYDDWLNLLTVSCDDTIYMGWLWKHQLQREGTFIKIKGKDNFLFKDIENHYKIVSSKSNYK